MGALEGKVVLVTGGGRGIGRAAVLHLAREGASVVVGDSGVGPDGAPGASTEDPAGDTVAAVVAQGGRAVAFRDPIHRQGAAEAAVALATEAYGRLDALVTCAGIVRDGSILKMELEDFREVLDVHASGAFLCTKAAARQMIAQGEGGRIVHASGSAGLLGNQGQVNLAAALAATYAITRTAAIELQRQRITVNAVAPLAKTRLTEELPLFQGSSTLGAEHVAPAIAFLASDRCGERTGFAVGVAGAQLYAYRLVQTAGRFKDAGEIWTEDEIAEHWDAIVRA